MYFEYTPTTTAVRERVEGGMALSCSVRRRFLLAVLCLVVRRAMEVARARAIQGVPSIYLFVEDRSCRSMILGVRVIKNSHSY